MKTNFDNQNFKRKLCKNIEAKILMYKTLLKNEYERAFFSNGKWPMEKFLNLNQGNNQAKDDENKSLDKHLVNLETCTNSSGVFLWRYWCGQRLYEQSTVRTQNKVLEWLGWKWQHELWIWHM